MIHRETEINILICSNNGDMEKYQTKQTEIKLDVNRWVCLICLTKMSLFTGDWNTVTLDGHYIACIWLSKL